MTHLVAVEPQAAQAAQHRRLHKAHLGDNSRKAA